MRLALKNDGALHRGRRHQAHRLYAGHWFDLARLDAGETLMQIARTYNVSHMTIARLKPSHTPTE